MPYFGEAHVQVALEALKGAKSITLGILSMIYHGVPTSDDPADAVAFGSNQDNEFLEKYSRPAGGPPGRPFYVPFDKEQGKTRWRDDQYAGRTIQRQRTKDYVQYFLHPDRKRFAVKKEYARRWQEDLKGFPIAYLAAWFFRQREISSIEGSINELITEFKLDRDGLIGSVFNREVPSNFDPRDLRTEPLSDGDIALLLGVGAPPPPPAFGREEVDARILSLLNRRNIAVRPDMIAAVVDGWLARDIVVLVGAPGTGKTVLAKALAEAVATIFSNADVVTHHEQVTREHDSARFLGYENLEGQLVPSGFSKSILLAPSKRFSLVPLVLDEWNLARIDNYFAQMLASIETGDPIALPGARDDEDTFLPVDTLIIATCNSYVDEPDTREPLSAPVKRRSVILEMPNLLATEVVKEGAASALRKFGDLMLTREREEVENRFSTKAATTFDHFRRSALTRNPTYQDLPEKIRRVLENIFETLMKSSSGSRGVTLGVFKDVIVSVAYSASPTAMETTLCNQVAGKLLHMLRDDLSILKSTAECCSPLSAYELVREALRRFEELSRRAGGVVMPTI